jgi:hypothetical protein
MKRYFPSRRDRYIEEPEVAEAVAAGLTAENVEAL